MTIHRLPVETNTFLLHPSVNISMHCFFAPTIILFAATGSVALAEAVAGELYVCCFSTTQIGCCRLLRSITASGCNLSRSVTIVS